MGSLRGLDPAFVGIGVAYSLTLLAIGYYGFSRTDDEADFLVAGREVGPVVGGATIAATQMSAGTFVGALGFHYVFGVGFVWIWVGLWTGWLFSLAFVAPQMRRFGRMTVPDFFAERYGDDGADGDYVRAVSAVLIMAGHTVFLTAQLTAGGLVIHAIAGVSQEAGMVGMLTVSVVYTAFGGMRASVITDFVQTVVMLAGLLAALPLALEFAGGVATIDALFASFRPSFVGQAFSAPEIVGFMAASAFYIAVGPPEITRFYSMADEETVRESIVIALVVQAVVAVTVALLGVSLRVLFPGIGTPDLAVVVLSQAVLGPVLGALLVVAVFSAILGTIDSVMLVSGSSLAHDVYAKLLNPTATERQKLWVNRAAVPVLGGVGALLALNRGALGGLVMLIVILQLSLLGGMLFVPVVFGLHWERANTPGAVASMLSGFVTVCVWHLGTEVYAVVPEAVAVFGDPVVPAVAVSFLVLVAVSLATDRPSVSSLDPFFDVRASDGGPGADGERREED